MHTLICGVTESGKTTLAHKLAEFDSQNKDVHEIIIFDPMMTETMAGTWPEEKTALFDDKQKFLNYIARKRSDDFAVYIDEAGFIFPQHERDHVWIMTNGRHYGYSVTLICQRPKMILPSARNQCTRFCVFRLAGNDRREMAADTGHDEWGGKVLDQGEFLCAYSGRNKYTQHNIFKLLKERKGSPSWKSICTPPLSPSS